jgi:hypothetical protein
MATRGRKVVAYAAAGVVLAGVFATYLRPEMMISIGDMIWACFR